MADHFESIGFTLERPEFETLLRRAFAEGDHFVAPHGDYHVWHAGAAELWVNIYRLGKRRELAGANPHFDGGARMAVIVESLDRNAEFPLEGELFAWAALPGDGDDTAEHGLYPFSASVPNYDLLAGEREPPFRATLALAGFARTVAWWPDDAAFQAAQRADDPDGVALAAASFLPTGLFGKNAGHARSQALVVGTVTASKEQINAATGRGYRSLRVETYGGEIDIVASETLLPDMPGIGSIVQADCWLSGRIVSRP
jgi:hypothetical protein